MRHFAPKFLALLALSFAITAASAQDVIQWAPSIDHARAMAAQQNKLLLIHFWTPTCGPCKVIDAKVFPSPEVVRAINENYVPLKVDASKETALTQHFGVQQWPTDVISTVDGRALHRMVTDNNAHRYVAKLGTLAQQHAPDARYNPNQTAVANAAPTRAAVQPALGKRKPMALAQVPTMSQEYAAAQQNALAQQPAPQPKGPRVQQSIQQPKLSPATPLQQPQRGESRWGDQNAGDRTAMARRPGISPSMRPGAGLGANQPGYSAPRINGMVGGMTPQTNQFAKAPGVAMPVIGQQQPNANMPVIEQRRANENMPVISGPPANNVARNATEIQNPYASVKPNPAQPQVAQTQTAQPPAVQPRPQVAQTQVAQTPALQAPTRPAQVQVPPAQQPTPSRFDNSATTIASRTPGPASVGFAPAAPPAQPKRAEPEASSIGVAQPPPVGLDGRCPVWLITKGQWKKGNKQFGAIHRGQTYLFTSKEAQQTFLSNPDEYSPVLAGMDVVRLAANGSVTQGTRRYGILFDDDGAGPRKSRMYLFDSVESRNQFESEPDRYLEPVMQAQREGRLDQFIR